MPVNLTRLTKTQNLEWSEPYPDSWFLPGTGAQRGTTYLDEGDPETPFYPSIEGKVRQLV